MSHERVRPTPVRVRHFPTVREGWGSRRARFLYPFRVIGMTVLYAGCLVEILAAIYLASLFVPVKP